MEDSPVCANAFSGEVMPNAFLRQTLLALPLIFHFGLALATLELTSQVLDYVREHYGEEAVHRVERWERLTKVASSAARDRQLAMVNSFFNRMDFVTDLQHWGEEDYWATPLELLTTNGGDCEDFSIAKYLTLRNMGVPDEELRITYVKALALNQSHMVLAWYPSPGAEPLILDNLINEIKPASQRTDLEPIYSFNGDGLWLNKRGGHNRRVGNPDELSHWNRLNEKLMESVSGAL